MLNSQIIMEVLTDPTARVFGRDYFDLSTVNGVFSGQVKTAEASSPEELRMAQAKARGEFLIIRVSSAPDGSPLTMNKMVSLLQEVFDGRNLGKILYDTTWYQDEAFFMEDTPREGLALVSKTVLPNSTGKNYWQQTDLLAEFIGEVYGEEIPSIYQDALDEWVRERDALQRILTSDYKGAAKGLAELQIQLIREKPVEVLQDSVVSLLTIGERRLVNRWTWTNARTSDGNFVRVGDLDPNGGDVADWDPLFGRPYVGVCSSRSII